MAPLACTEKSIEESSLSKKVQVEAGSPSPRDTEQHQNRRHNLLVIVVAVVGILVTVLIGLLQLYVAQRSLDAQTEQNLDISKFPEKFASEIAQLVNRAPAPGEQAAKRHVDPKPPLSQKTETTLVRLCADPSKLLGRFLPLRTSPDPNARIIARIPSGSTDLRVRHSHIIRTKTWWRGSWHKARWTKIDYHTQIGFVAYEFVSEDLDRCEQAKISYDDQLVF